MSAATTPRLDDSTVWLDNDGVAVDADYILAKVEASFPMANPVVPFVFCSNSEIRAALQLFERRPHAPVRKTLSHAAQRLCEAQEVMRLAFPFFQGVVTKNRGALTLYFEHLFERPSSDLQMCEAFIDSLRWCVSRRRKTHANQLDVMVQCSVLDSGRYDTAQIKTVLRQMSELLAAHQADRLMDELDRRSDTA